MLKPVAILQSNDLSTSIETARLLHDRPQSYYVRSRRFMLRNMLFIDSRRETKWKVIFNSRLFTVESIIFHSIKIGKQFLGGQWLWKRVQLEPLIISRLIIKCTSPEFTTRRWYFNLKVIKLSGAPSSHPNTMWCGVDGVKNLKMFVYLIDVYVL